MPLLFSESANKKGTSMAKSSNLSRRSFVTLGAMTVAGVALAGCASDEEEEGSAEEEEAEEEEEEEEEEAADTVELQIFAANSLELALAEVQELYTENNPSITFADTQFKASGDLVEQIAAGASCDILITASSSTMNNAEEYIDTDTRVDMFTNELVIVIAEDSDTVIEDITDIEDLGGTVGIGEPNTVPAGKYALQSLTYAGITEYETDDDGVITITSAPDYLDYGSDKVGTVASHVSTGDFVAGFVYSSDVYRYDGIVAAYTTESESHNDILYPGAILADSAYPEEAAAFLDYCLTDPEAQQIFSSYGFELVG